MKQTTKTTFIHLAIMLGVQLLAAGAVLLGTLIPVDAHAFTLDNGDKLELSVDVTHHFGQQVYDNNNNIHPMLAYETKEGWTLGTYFNSERTVSTFAGKKFYTDDGKFSLGVGLVTGYKDMPIAPAIVAEYHYSENVKFFAFPTIEKNHGPAQTGSHFELVTGVKFVY